VHPPIDGRGERLRGGERRETGWRREEGLRGGESRETAWRRETGWRREAAWRREERLREGERRDWVEERNCVEERGETGWRRGTATGLQKPSQTRETDGDRNAELSNANKSFADHRVTGDLHRRQKPGWGRGRVPCRCGGPRRATSTCPSPASPPTSPRPSGQFAASARPSQQGSTTVGPVWSDKATRRPAAGPQRQAKAPVDADRPAGCQCGRAADSGRRQMSESLRPSRIQPASWLHGLQSAAACASRLVSTGIKATCVSAAWESTACVSAAWESTACVSAACESTACVSAAFTSSHRPSRRAATARWHRSASEHPAKTRPDRQGLTRPGHVTANPAGPRKGARSWADRRGKIKGGAPGRRAGSRAAALPASYRRLLAGCAGSRACLCVSLPLLCTHTGLGWRGPARQGRACATRTGWDDTGCGDMDGSGQDLAVEVVEEGQHDLLARARACGPGGGSGAAARP
jgi:hypothetical protein